MQELGFTFYSCSSPSLVYSPGVSPGTVVFSKTGRVTPSTLLLMSHFALGLHHCTPLVHPPCGSSGRSGSSTQLQSGLVNILEGFGGETSPACVKKSRLTWESPVRERTDVQLECWVLHPVNARSLKPRGTAAAPRHCHDQVCEANHKTCALYLAGREHAGCGKSRPGISCPPTHLQNKG